MSADDTLHDSGGTDRQRAAGGSHGARPRASASHEGSHTGQEGSSGGFLKTALGALAGLAGLGALSRSASAGSQKRVVVIGDGTREHTYEIRMESGGTIQKDTHAGGNDTHYTRPTERVEGELWHWNADSYRYTGNIDYVVGDGQVAFHFPDSAFGYSKTELTAAGQSSGSHEYAIASEGANIEFVSGTAESNDTNAAVGSDSTWTPERVEGQLTGTGSDSVGFLYDSIQTVETDGHVKFS